MCQPSGEKEVNITYVWQFFQMHVSKVKGKGARFNDSIHIVTKTVGVEASGCEQLAQSRYAAAATPQT